MGYLEYASFEPGQEPASAGGPYRALDRAPQQVYDRFARLAAHCCRATAAVLVLPGEAEAAPTSVYGLDQCRWLEDGVLRSRALEAGTLLEVDDAREDEQLAGSILVKEEPGVRLFAACPIGEGPERGALLVMDTEPRHLSDAEREGLVDLAALAAEEVERRRQANAARVADHEHLQAKLLDNAPLVFFVLDPDGTFLLMRGRGLDTLGLEPDQLVGQSAFDAYGAYPHVLDNMSRALAGEEVHVVFPLDELEMEVWYRPVTNAAGEVEEVVGTVLDVTDRERAVAALRRQRDLLKQTQRLAGAWEVDLRTGDITWSEEVYRIHELPVGTEVDVDEALDFYAEASRRVVRAAFERTVSDGTPYDLELRLFTARGNRRWVRSVGAAVEEDGEVVKVVGAFQDITHRKEVELELRRSREHLEEAQRIAHLGSWTHDFEEERVYWSDESRRIFGWGPDEPLTVENIMAAVPSDDWERLHQQRQALIERGEALDMEHRVIRPDGEERIVRLRGAVERNAEGEVVRLHGTSLDVTDQRRAEKQIRLQATALEAAANAIAITGRDGYITWVNPAFTELTGYAEEEAIGQTMQILRSGEQDPSFYKDLWQTVRAGSVWRGELVNRHKDGQLYVEEQTITPVRDEDGIIHHFIAIKQDVTRRVEYEQGLDSARLRAEELNRLKDTVLMNMSHELRTPLATIIGYSDVLHGLVAEEHRELVEAVRRGGDRLLETLTLVLELAQVKSGKRVLATSRFDVCQCVRDEVKGLRAPAEHEGVAVVVRVPDEQVWMMSDPSAVGRIVQCLLSNAIKFTPEGDVRVTVDASDTSVQIEVVDTGIGIAADALPHLFEAFRQESSGIARNYEGSGVGLAVVQRLVTLLNGAVEVESEKGKGSTFRVTLPRHVQQGADSQ